MASRDHIQQQQYTLGKEKVSVTITRKTEGDLIVSQHSSERWFQDASSAEHAMKIILSAFIEPEASDGGQEGGE